MNQTSSPFHTYPMILEMRSAVESDLRNTIRSDFPEKIAGLRKMLEYHMGWLDGEHSGKRLRPLFILLAAYAAGGDWHKAIPAASAVELIHNFSLIHDDIQDKSEFRHNRPTLWTTVGVPQAINAGDAMFTTGLKKIWELEKHYPLETAKRCSSILQQTCLRLTIGQYLDIDFENRLEVEMNEYLEMINGKTTSLITACMQIGAILGSPDPQIELNFSQYGHNLGMAFQIVDDYLGIWGSEDMIGKSAATDLMNRKKSYPVIIGLSSIVAFRNEWRKPEITEDDATRLAGLLEKHGVKKETMELAKKYSQQAIDSLKLACAQTEALDLMENLTRWLAFRDV